MVTCRSNLKTFKHANNLLAALKVALRFPYTETSEPEIHYLAGDRRRGMMCVKLDIAFDLSCKSAQGQLESHGFIRHLEDILD